MRCTKNPKGFKNFIFSGEKQTILFLVVRWLQVVCKVYMFCFTSSFLFIDSDNEFVPSSFCQQVVKVTEWDLEGGLTKAFDGLRKYIHHIQARLGYGVYVKCLVCAATSKQVVTDEDTDTWFMDEKVSVSPQQSVIKPEAKGNLDNPRGTQHLATRVEKLENM